MPIKLNVATIDPCAIPTKEVTIPDSCPNCGSDLTEEGSLVEEQFHYSNQYMSIEKNVEGDLAKYGSGSCVYESTVTVGCRCYKCKHPLAE